VAAGELGQRHRAVGGLEPQVRQHHPEQFVVVPGQRLDAERVDVQEGGQPVRLGGRELGTNTRGLE
jgi:hypothetical protein